MSIKLLRTSQHNRPFLSSQVVGMGQVTLVLLLGLAVPHVLH